MIILSIDSGLEKTGYCLFEINPRIKDNFKYLDSGIVKTSPSSKIEKRIEQIYSGLLKIVIRYKPKKIIIEQLFFFKNQKTVICVSQTQGAVMLLASQKKIDIDFLTPLQIKQTVTGYGNADKKSIKKMICLLLPDKIKIADDDQSDAIACGLAYCYLHRNTIK